jgi:hypothetical protein
MRGRGPFREDSRAERTAAPTAPGITDRRRHLGGDDFTFRLLGRSLDRGPGQVIRYYWMDSTQFRITRARRPSADPANFRACGGHWWRAMQACGWADDHDQLCHLVLATTYGLVGADKGPQRVYRDAHLAPEATQPEERSLPDDVCSRVLGLVRGRDAQAVGEEMDSLLGVWEIPQGQERALRQAIDGLVEAGVQLVAAEGSHGLEQFVGTFDTWCAKTRRKGGQDFLRRVLDGISYLSKCSFYLCHANAWISLIPWLRERHGLDVVSERFLRFWHCQNQPVERPDGTVIPDVFRGQVLSLHPLSGFFMKDPGLCAVAGQFFGSADAHDRVFVQGRTDCGEYWDLVGAILTAAHLYRLALDEQQQKRGVRERNGAAAIDEAVAPSELSVAGLLEQFAAARGLRCPNCHGPVCLDERRSDRESDGDFFQAHFTCRGGCGRSLALSIAEDELREWLVSR